MTPARPRIQDPDPGSPHGFLGVTVRRPVGVFMVLLAIGLFGFTSLGRLPLNLLPDLNFPTVTVRTTWDGAAPEEIEERVTRPLEEGLRMVPGLAEVTSVSRAGVSSIRLRFGWGTDMRFASQDVSERVQQTRNTLPPDAESPLILRYDPTLEPVLRFAVVAREGRTKAPLTEIRRYADEDLSRELEKLEGVASAKVKGGVEEEIHLDLREDLLAAAGLTVQDVANRLREESVDVAAGSLLDGDTEYLVRTQNQVRSTRELEELIVGRRGKSVIRMRDVGVVRRAGRERDLSLQVNGTQGVLVEVYREAGANLVEVARRVRETLYGTAAQQAYVTLHSERLQQERANAHRDTPLAKESEKKPDKAKGGQRGRRGGRRGGWGGRGGGQGGFGEEGEQKRLDRSMTAFLEYQSPEDMDLVLIEDSSVFVGNALDEVKLAVFLGGILAVLVLYLFLRRMRPTLIIAVSLPASVLFTFAAMFLFDVSLNLMSLGGLALGIGMLVDNSIVVLESIVRCREEGDELTRAVLRGTREVGSAVVASTLTTVAVFLPIVFVVGVAGQIFRDQAVTVVLSLLASLAAALFLIPMLASRRLPETERADLPKPWRFPATRLRYARLTRGPWSGRPLALLILPAAAALELIGTVLFGVLVLGVGRAGGALVRHSGLGRRVVAPITGLFDRAYDAVEQLYAPFLAKALKRRRLTLGIAAGLIVYAALLYPFLGAELLPRIHQGLFNVEVALPVTTPVDETERILAAVVPELRAIEGIEQIAGIAGVDRNDVEAADEGSHTGRLRIRLEERLRSADGEQQVLEQVRAVLARRPELNAPRIAFPELVSLRSTLDVELIDDNLTRLREDAATAAHILEGLPALADVRTGLGRGTPEVLLELEPEVLARYDLTRRQVADVVRAKVQGERPARITDERRLEVRVALSPADLVGVDALKRLRVDQGGEARPVLLGDVAEVRIANGPSEIIRVRGKRVHRLSANLAPGMDLATAAAEAEEALAAGLGPAVDFRVVGQSEELARSQSSMLLALLTAAFLVYVVMASQFESLLQPILIVVTVPLAFVGVLTVLFLMGEPVGVVVLIGAIVLAGIVVNNAIVLIDTTNQMRARGMGPAEAVSAAGHLRLRPIIMTTATTVLGLLPMLLQGGAGSEIRRPLALAVAAGLISATALTLIVIPVLYTSVEELLERRRGRRPALPGGGGAPPARPSPPVDEADPAVSVKDVPPAPTHATRSDIIEQVKIDDAVSRIFSPHDGGAAP